MASLKDRLWRVLKLELPNVNFDSENLEYFMSLLETKDVTEDQMCEVFGPFLQSYGVVMDDDDDAIRDVCRKILTRLHNQRFWSSESAAPGADAAGGRTPKSAEKAVVSPAAAGEDSEAVVGLDAWLEKMRLNMYREKAIAWCKEMGAVDIGEVIEFVEDFSQAMGLKPLEHKRVLKAKTEKAAVNGKGAASTTAQKGGYPTPEGANTTRKKEITVAPEAPEVPCLKTIGEDSRKYYLQKKIGEGVSATVYKSVRYEEGELKEYAVKEVSLHKLKMHGDFDRITSSLKREVSVLFSLRHKNIVSLYDVIDIKESTLYLILEYVSGGDLFEYIVTNGCLEENQARFVFLQLVDALKHIHSKGIVHRDLKPENILIAQAAGAGLDVKISDFGHSKLVNDGYSLAMSKVGTPQYWAPEVSDGSVNSRKEKGYDQRADLWSLGVVLYVMLEGTYPFDGVEKRIELQIQRAEVKFKAPHRPSPNARDIITGLIKVKPQDRMTLDQLSRKPWFMDDALGRVYDEINSESARQQAGSRPQNAVAQHELLDHQWAHPHGVPRPEGWDEIIELPHGLTSDPHNVKNVKQFRKDLQIFNTNRKHGSSLSDKKQVSVTWRSDDKAARDELFVLLKYYFPLDGHPAGPPVQDQSRSLAPVREEVSSKARGKGGSVRFVGPFKLNVDKEFGAGLELEEKGNGMLVKLVDDNPGQPNLRVGDLITKIDTVKLGPNKEQVRETFGRYFRHGVEIEVKRQTAG